MPDPQSIQSALRDALARAANLHLTMRVGFVARGDADACAPAPALDRAAQTAQAALSSLGLCMRMDFAMRGVGADCATGNTAGNATDADTAAAPTP